MSLNDLQVVVYERLSTTRRRGGLDGARILHFSTYFPGGLYGTAAIFIPWPIRHDIPWKEGDRLVIRNSLTVVWEGEIGEIGRRAGFQAEEGVTLYGVGLWGALLGNRTIDRRWCDMRTGEGAWEINTDLHTNGGELATYDRSQGRLQITPKSEAWGNGENAAFEYQAPTGETVGRVAGTYDLQEAAQAWRLLLREYDGPFNFLDITASATSTFDQDHTGTPVQTLYFRLNSQAAQTPVADGTIYIRLTGLKVYRYKSTDATVPDVQLQNIVADMLNDVSDVNSDTTHIDTPGTTFDIEPFITDGPEPWNKVLSRAASYGDGASPPNSWYVRLLHSETAATPDGKPVVECAQYPALTDWDYAVSIDEHNVQGVIDIRRSVSNVKNWIVIKYRDVDEERNVVLSPDDDSNLTDTTSTADWDQRDIVIDIGVSDTATATNIGKRILAARKDAKFYVNGPITLAGYVRAKNGSLVAASEIQAGKRIKIENFLTDPVGVSGAGLTFHITHTEYNDLEGNDAPAETCRISTGIPDNLSVLLAQLNLRFA